MCLLHECHFIGVITTCTITYFFKKTFINYNNYKQMSLVITLYNMISDFKNNLDYIPISKGIMSMVSHLHLITFRFQKKKRGFN